jgi:hypothetical protein
LKPQAMFFFAYLSSNIARGFNHGERIVKHFKIQFLKNIQSLRIYVAFLRLKPQAMFFFAYLSSNIARGFNHGERNVKHFQIQF